VVTFGVVAVARGGLMAPVTAAAVAVCVAAVAVPLIGVATLNSGLSLRAWRSRRRRRRAIPGSEMRVRALMSELCPHGWRAQITVEAADGERQRVAVEWAELSARDGQPLVSRRVWGSTIGEALDAMVCDRRTDETLERIERGAVADGARWPEQP
jgi:hypothetical protein